MELERRAREARERAERNRLKAATAKHVNGAVERRARGRLAHRVLSERRHRARHRMPLAACRLPRLPATRRDRLAQARHSPERLDRRRDPRHVLPAMLAASAVREATRRDQAVLVRRRRLDSHDDVGAGRDPEPRWQRRHRMGAAADSGDAEEARRALSGPTALKNPDHSSVRLDDRHRLCGVLFLEDVRRLIGGSLKVAARRSVDADADTTGAGVR